jgi:hypothetical protein
MLNIRKTLLSSVAMALLIACVLLIGQLTAPSASAAGLELPDVNWGN